MPLLYLHGAGLTRRWLELYEELSKRYDVIVPEHPGFGDTERPRWYRNLDDIVVHYADFLAALDLSAVHVVGHSLGGVIAGSFAALYPERVRSLTLIAPAPLPTVTPDDALAPPRDVPADFDFDSLLFNDNQQQYPEYRNGNDHGHLLAAVDGDSFANPDAWRLAAAPTLYRRIARFSGPAQVIVPEQDRLLQHDWFDAWARYLGGAPLVRIRGEKHETGHLLIVQEPGRIAAQIHEFCG